MPEKSCVNCKHCRKLIRMHDESKNLYLCFEYYNNGDAIDVTPPYDDACETWELSQKYRFVTVKGENRV